MKKGAPSSHLFPVLNEFDVQNLHLSKKGDKTNFLLVYVGVRSIILHPLAIPQDHSRDG